jgi:hypothetical protein
MDPRSYVQHAERTVLDIAHRTMPLWSVPSSTAAYALLWAFDVHPAVSDPDAPTWEGDALDIQNALSQALEWVRKDAPVLESAPTDVVPVRDAAAQFLHHARDFWRLSLVHRAYWAGDYVATVDDRTNTVTFRATRPGSAGITRLARSFADDDFLGRGHEERLRELASAMRPAFQMHSTPFQPRMGTRGFELRRPDDLFCQPVVAASLRVIHARTVVNELAPMREDADLGGFTVAELDRFWAAMSAWSFAAIQVSKAVRTRGGLPVPDITCTQVAREAELRRTISVHYGVEQNRVAAIIDRLKYRDVLSRNDVYLQPLIPSGKSVAWSPFLVCQSRYRRNMLKRMTRDVGLSAIAATANGGREEAGLTLLANVLHSKGHAVCLPCVRLTLGQDRTEADLLAWWPSHPDELLMVQLKATLAPADRNEVVHQEAELRHAVAQAARCTAILREKPAADLPTLGRDIDWGTWARSRRIFSLAVVTDGHPDPALGDDRIAVIGMSFLTFQLPLRAYESPSALFAASRRAYADDGEGWEVRSERISVGSVTYEFPVLFPSAAAGGSRVAGAETR